MGVDRSAVKAVVDRELEPLKERFGIPHWRTSVDLQYRDPEATGECKFYVDYNNATIGLDCEAIDDEDHLLKVLRHELFHIVLSPFNLYGGSVDAFVPADSPERKVLDRVWRHVTEQGVINLERLYRGMTSCPDATPGPTSPTPTRNGTLAAPCPTT